MTKTMIKIYNTSTTRTHYIVVPTTERAFNKMNELMDEYTNKGVNFLRMDSFTLYID